MYVRFTVCDPCFCLMDSRIYAARYSASPLKHKAHIGFCARWGQEQNSGIYHNKYLIDGRNTAQELRLLCIILPLIPI